MEPLQHDRDLNKLKDAWGIKDGDWGEKSRLDPHLKGVVIVDDARHLVRPLTVPSGAFYSTAPAGGAATYAYVKVVSNCPRGAAVTYARSSLALSVYTQTAPGGVDTPGALSSPILQGSDRALAQTVVSLGWNSAIPSFFHWQDGTNDWKLVPFWLEPGVPLYIHALQANTSLIAALSIQEIA